MRSCGGAVDPLLVNTGAYRRPGASCGGSGARVTSRFRLQAAQPTGLDPSVREITFAIDAEQQHAADRRGRRPLAQSHQRQRAEVGAPQLPDSRKRD